MVFNYISIYKNICYDSNIFQEFWVNLVVFCKKLVLLIILLSLDKILRFFCVVIQKCLADTHTHTGKLCCLAGQLLFTMKIDLNYSNKMIDFTDR